MIGRLRGTVVEAAAGRVTLDVGGVGYEVRVPESAAKTLAVGSAEVAIHTHAAYAADGAELYGFLTRAERDVFRQVIGVSSVGPRTALALLSEMTLDEFRSALIREDARPLVAVSGVGKKTAQRLVLELKEKALVWPTAAPATDAETPVPRGEDVAVAALVNLGYRPAQAARAVEIARTRLDPDAALEDVIRRALQEAV